MHERRLSLLDADRSQKIDDLRKICPNGEAGRPAHRQADYWFFFSLFFRLGKDGTFFSFCFFFHTSAAALYLLSLTSVKQSRMVGTTIFLRRSYTTPMALESSRLAELKYAISAAWDVKKKLRLSIGCTWTKLFLARRAYCRKAKSWGQIVRPEYSRRAFERKKQGFSAGLKGQTQKIDHPRSEWISFR